MRISSNNNIVKTIAHQLRNNNNLPIDARYIRHFDPTTPNITTREDFLNDYAGMLVYNTFNNILYICKKQGDTLVYSPLSGELVTDVSETLIVNDENYNNITIKKPITTILPLNVTYLRLSDDKLQILAGVHAGDYESEFFGIDENTTVFDFTSEAFVKNLPKKLRENKSKIIYRNTTDNTIYYFDYQTNKSENLIKTFEKFSESDIVTHPQKIENNRVYYFEDLGTYHVGKVNFVNGESKSVLLGLVPPKRQYSITTTLKHGGITIEHQLKNRHLKVFIKVITPQGVTINKEISENDFDILTENAIFVKSDFVQDLPNTTIEIFTNN